MKKLIVTAITAVALSSCGTIEVHRAKNAFSYRYKCPKEDVTVLNKNVEFADAVYIDLEGCDMSANYRCNNTGCVEQ